MHRGGRPDLEDLQWVRRRWDGAQAYADSKFYDVVLAFAVARRWPDVLSNALEPGWVPTKMGGPGAPDDLSLAAVTQVWLAVSDDPAATVTGNYFYHQQCATFTRQPGQSRFKTDCSTAAPSSRELCSRIRRRSLECPRKVGEQPCPANSSSKVATS